MQSRIFTSSPFVVTKTSQLQRLLYPPDFAYEEATPKSYRELEANPVLNPRFSYLQTRAHSLDQTNLLSNLAPTFPEGQKNPKAILFFKKLL